jgi:hypothetical protein
LAGSQQQQKSISHITTNPSISAITTAVKTAFLKASTAR